ncbi:uncharacterized protein LOC110026522, partial [Phalaenopsis equestris]|uniref:uncharacterized protein LOC110026522 n=1 Tax=Phalaenopsis equestris TaxID=78828 RepID=UPI0009E58A86
MLHYNLTFYPFPLPSPPPSSSSMFPPASLLPSQEELMVDELLDLRGMPEQENKVEEKEEDTKKASFIPLEKNESVLLSEIRLPEENEATNLEWLSRFVHDCNSPESPASPPVTAGPAASFYGFMSTKPQRTHAPP